MIVELDLMLEKGKLNKIANVTPTAFYSKVQSNIRIFKVVRVRSAATATYLAAL